MRQGNKMLNDKLLGTYLAQLITHFMVAFGIVLGACLLAGITAVITLKPPAQVMNEYALNIKIWAVIAAVGGTIDPFRSIESKFLDGQLSPAIQDILVIVTAFLGAQAGVKLILLIGGSGVNS